MNFFERVFMLKKLKELLFGKPVEAPVVTEVPYKVEVQPVVETAPTEVVQAAPAVDSQAAESATIAPVKKPRKPRAKKSTKKKSDF